MATIVAAAKREFGIHQKVSATLYKLLVYEKGSFFAPHRDSEKASGMFATMVVCLPSRHEGGTLVVRHDGQTKKIDFGGEHAEFQLQYAAFYADCQHEITPVSARLPDLPRLQSRDHWKETAARCAPKRFRRRESGPTAQGALHRPVEQNQQDGNPSRA